MLSDLESVHMVSLPLLKAMEESANIRSIHRKVTLLSEGSIQHSLWYLVHGFAREYQNDPNDGNEATNWFWQSGDFVFHNHFVNGERSEVSIDFYSGSALLEIDLIALSENTKILEEFTLIKGALTDFNMSLRHEHLRDLSKLTRLQHVKKFYDSHQMLFNFVRHKDLASFFGIRDKSIYRYLKGL